MFQVHLRTMSSALSRGGVSESYFLPFGVKK